MCQVECFSLAICRPNLLCWVRLWLRSYFSEQRGWLKGCCKGKYCTATMKTSPAFADGFVALQHTVQSVAKLADTLFGLIMVLSDLFSLPGNCSGWTMSCCFFCLLLL